MTRQNKTELPITIVGFSDTCTISAKPKWISVKEKLPDCEKVLAICVSKPGVSYNLRHDGWFRDTIYACWMEEGKFIIESHGPSLPATHWLPLPLLPNDYYIYEN